MTDYLPSGTHLQNGHFQLIDVLGQGGYGITYLADDMHLDRQVAIKEFFPAGCLRQGMNVVPGHTLSPTRFAEAKQKFLEEVRVLARFRHPSIVQVYTHFEENQTGYMVMEFLQGKTLAEVVAENGPLSEKDAVRFIDSIGQALSIVHKANIVHRDVKPENIILCDDGHVVLIDFGLTKQEVADTKGTRPLTGTSAVGTDGYAPPEQYSRNTQFGPPTDIYALGAALTFLLTGDVPLSATERAAGEELPALRERNPHLSPAISQAVAQAMAMPVRQRPAQVELFLKMLHSSTTAAGLQKSSGAHQRAQIALGKWQEALQAVQQAEQTAQYPLPLPDRLIVGVEEAWHHLQHADWALLIGIEKEAEVARDEVIALAKNELQLENNRRQQLVKQLQQTMQALELERERSIAQLDATKEPLIQAATREIESAKRKIADTKGEVGRSRWIQKLIWFPSGCAIWYILALIVGAIREVYEAAQFMSVWGILELLAVFLGWRIAYPLASYFIRRHYGIDPHIELHQRIATAERQIENAKNDNQRHMAEIVREFADNRQILEQQLDLALENEGQMKRALQSLNTGG